MSSLNVTITGRKDGFAINLQMCKFVANLTFKFASTLQWLFYIFATQNLQYIHACLYTYANLWDQICNRFAMVVLLSLLYQICNTYTHTFSHTQIHWIKFASDSLWLFYYLYYIKFPLHTPINFAHTKIHWIKFASDLQWLFYYL